MNSPAKKPKSTSAGRVAAYRQRLRARGLVPRTIWVYDTKDPKFLAELQRQCAAIAADKAHEREINEWLERAYEGHDLGPIPPYRLLEKK